MYVCFVIVFAYVCGEAKLRPLSYDFYVLLVEKIFSYNTYLYIETWYLKTSKISLNDNDVLHFRYYFRNVHSSTIILIPQVI